MSKIDWASQERSFEVGVDRGVLYPEGAPGVPWNGLTAVSETPEAPSGGATYLDGQKVFIRPGRNNFVSRIECYTYPIEFERFDGILNRYSAQSRPTLGLSYRSSNKIHLIYNALAIPTQKSHSTLSDRDGPLEFSWDLHTLPEEFGGFSPTSHLVVDLKTAHEEVVENLEDLLYGTDVEEPRLPTPGEIYDLFVAHATLIITDHGDGTWSADGPDHMFEDLGDDAFAITSESAIYTTSQSYDIWSY